MGTAVERLEIWTAFALLMVALFVGTAGTLYSVGAAEKGAARASSRPPAAKSSIADTVSALAELPTMLAGRAYTAGAQAESVIARLPGGGFGLVAAALAGVAGVPLSAAAARSLRLAAMARPLRMLQQTHRLRRLHFPARRVRPKTVAQAEQSCYAPPLPEHSPTSEQAKIPSGEVAAVEPASVQAEPLPAAPQAFAPAREAGGAGSSEEDTALAATQAVQSLMASSNVHSPLLALDIVGDEALVMLDLRPEDEAKLDRAFAEQQPATSQYLRWAPPTIRVKFEPGAGVSSATTAMPVPLLALGRRKVRYAPLESWRHLGIYGGRADAAAHHVVATLLCQRRPDELGLAVLDRHGWASLYRNTPHWVDTPGDGPATADALARALRRGGSLAPRPVLLVLVDPDSASLSAFATLLGRLSLQPAAPLHLLLVQRRLHPQGRQLYLTLPALITAGGEAAPNLLPAVHRWPQRGNAVVLIRGQRWAGRPFEWDEAGVGELTQRLARFPRSSVPVLWQTPEPAIGQPVVVQTTGS